MLEKLKRWWNNKTCSHESATSLDFGPLTCDGCGKNVHEHFMRHGGTIRHRNTKPIWPEVSYEDWLKAKRGIVDRI